VHLPVELYVLSAGGHPKGMSALAALGVTYILCVRAKLTVDNRKYPDIMPTTTHP